MLVQPREIHQFPDEKRRDHLHRLAGRAALGAAPDGLPRPPAGRAQARRHRRLLRHADPGQRARGQRDDRPALPDRLRRRDGPRRADPRLRPRLPGRAQDDAQPDAAELRDAGPRRLQADAAARRAGPGGRRAAENIFRVENGTPLEIDADGARLGEPETAGMVFVDGVDIGDVADVALRDRRMLSADGILIIVATISEQDGSLGRRRRRCSPAASRSSTSAASSSTSCATPSRTRSTAPPSSA